MPDAPGIPSVGHAIQLAVTPVFLLLGIGTMLSVMTNRLARIVDRARGAEARLDSTAPDVVADLHGELAILSRRSRLINRAITFCTITALLICAVIATLFVGAFLEHDLSTIVAILFITAVSFLFIGFLYFLREIFIAVAALRIGPRTPN
jgi:hypothetical protein